MKNLIEEIERSKVLMGLLEDDRYRQPKKVNKDSGINSQNIKEWFINFLENLQIGRKSNNQLDNDIYFYDNKNIYMSYNTKTGSLLYDRYDIILPTFQSVFGNDKRNQINKFIKKILKDKYPSLYPIVPTSASWDSWAYISPDDLTPIKDLNNDNNISK